jgi:cytochrome P450
MVFLLAMVLYPNVALKLQAELDQVLGDAERLPVVQDREHMPYTQNSILEVLRWQPVNPLGKTP